MNVQSKLKRMYREKYNYVKSQIMELRLKWTPFSFNISE